MKLTLPDADSPPPFEMGLGVYALTTGGSISYLVTGAEKALVIDTGFGTVNVLEKARAVTEKPLVLVNTHGHMDHIGCDGLFGQVYAHPLEHDRIHRKNKNTAAVREGFVFELGGRNIEVLELPGHTPGGIGLLDADNKLLFGGDMISVRPVFLQFAYSDLGAYMGSMEKLLAMGEKISAVMCCHGTMVLGIEQAKKMLALAEAIQSGGSVEMEAVHLDTEDGGFDAKLYSMDGAKIYH